MILKEYLVALGWKVDEASFKKFNQSVSDSTKTVFAMGKTISEVTFAVGAGIEEMSRHLEDLYYAAQLAKTSVSNLQSVRYAAEQIGIGADGVTGAITSM